jgi:hypothetical protein
MSSRRGDSLCACGGFLEAALLVGFGEQSENGEGVGSVEFDAAPDFWAGGREGKYEWEEGGSLRVDN